MNNSLARQQSNGFSAKCYKLLLKVPPGKVTTYKELARAMGSTAYRAVGQAMKRNPDAPRVPCHRVVQSDGGLGGYAFGLPKKRTLLKSEGIEIDKDRVKNLKDVLYTFRS